jgi:hypothetical protein
MNNLNEQQKLNLETMNHFIGYGDPDSDKIYMGIEEHGGSGTGDINIEQEKLDVYIETYNKNIGKPFTLTNEDFQSYYVKYPYIKEREKIDDEKSQLYKIYKYLNNKMNENYKINCISDNLGSEKVKNFLSTNLYALPKKGINTSYDRITFKLFGVNPKEYKDYLTTRKKYLRDFINERSNKQKLIIFCFCIANEFKDFFEKTLLLKNLNFKGFPIDNFKKANCFYVYSNDNIIAFQFYHTGRGRLTVNHIDWFLSQYSELLHS